MAAAIDERKMRLGSSRLAVFLTSTILFLSALILFFHSSLVLLGFIYPSQRIPSFMLAQAIMISLAIMIWAVMGIFGSYFPSRLRLCGVFVGIGLVFFLVVVALGLFLIISGGADTQSRFYAYIAYIFQKIAEESSLLSQSNNSTKVTDWMLIQDYFTCCGISPQYTYFYAAKGFTLMNLLKIQLTGVVCPTKLQDVSDLHNSHAIFDIDAQEFALSKIGENFFCLDAISNLVQDHLMAIIFTFLIYCVLIATSVLSGLKLVLLERAVTYKTEDIDGDRYTPKPPRTRGIDNANMLEQNRTYDEEAAIQPLSHENENRLEEEEDPYFGQNEDHLDYNENEDDDDTYGTAENEEMITSNFDPEQPEKGNRKSRFKFLR